MSGALVSHVSIITSFCQRTTLARGVFLSFPNSGRVGVFVLSCLFVFDLRFLLWLCVLLCRVVDTRVDVISTVSHTFLTCSTLASLSRCILEGQWREVCEHVHYGHVCDDIDKERERLHSVFLLSGQSAHRLFFSSLVARARIQAFTFIALGSLTPKSLQTKQRQQRNKKGTSCRHRMHGSDLRVPPRLDGGSM